MSKRILKIAVGHVLGLSGVRWAEAWVAKRKAMGLDAHKDRCLLPAIDPADNSKFMKRRLRSHEYVRWLKGFLSKSRMWSPGAQDLGSHSAKATLLSWSAKYGLDFGTRRALGYHVPLKNRMVQVYSRDYQAAPMRKLELVESAVSDGEFRPDMPRSGMFKKRRREEGHKGPDPNEGSFILAKLYMKLHERDAGAPRSRCGRAHHNCHGFETHVEVPVQLARSVCKHCFKDNLSILEQS